MHVAIANHLSEDDQTMVATDDSQQQGHSHAPSVESSPGPQDAVVGIRMSIIATKARRLLNGLSGAPMGLQVSRYERRCMGGTKGRVIRSPPVRAKAPPLGMSKRVH